MPDQLKLPLIFQALYGLLAFAALFAFCWWIASITLAAVAFVLIVKGT